MKTVTPKRDYDHYLDPADHPQRRHAAYLAGVKVEVTDEVHEAMKAAGALTAPDPAAEPAAAA